jgi:hypothetical protein
MSTDPSELVVLVSVPNEIEAAAVAAALEQNGIQTIIAGGYTSGFKAEAPGDVNVLVKQSDADRAKQALREIRERGAGIDWSQVDVGDPQ